MSDRASAPTPVIVRRATRGDLDALARLEEAFPGDRVSRASFARFVDGATADVWVAELAGAVVGDAIVTYRSGFHGARLYSLVTGPAHRGRGVARALLDAAEAAAMERGCVSLRLEVRVDNDAAVKLYERRGYVVVGVTDDFYEDDSDALRMRKRLRSDAAR